MTERSTGLGRLRLLGTSHRVAPGLLSWDAWAALRSSRVLARAANPPASAEERTLQAAGVEVTALAPGLSDAELAAMLLDATSGSDVTYVSGPDGDPGLPLALASELSWRAESGRQVPVVETVAGSYDLPGARLLDLVAVMDRLRSPGGCPWDAEQTHTSLVRYLVEEAYEVVEAIETADRTHLREELGDLLLQVVFHARLAEEDADDPWNVDDVAAGIVEKLVRRHPHVFGDVEVSGAAEVHGNWEAIKAAEKGRTSVLDGVPLGQPALALADTLLGRAERAGLGPYVEHADAEADVGDALLSVVAAARMTGVDPEAALRNSCRRLAAHIAADEKPSEP